MKTLIADLLLTSFALLLLINFFMPVANNMQETFVVLRDNTIEAENRFDIR